VLPETRYLRIQGLRVAYQVIEDAGVHDLKGIEEPWHPCRLVG
jgi:hypothetical protein